MESERGPAHCGVIMCQLSIANPDAVCLNLATNPTHCVDPHAHPSIHTSVSNVSLLLSLSARNVIVYERVSTIG